ncbi:hypothetical protein SAMN06269173_102403 [Hymenobacter mucosus]|uniref:Uncharacterized protein n=1 Tax=Hymenobacter mucosus TaxID=1411120 RepID=A0A238WAX8_9BACT|nr:hypothetical protein SAMN06269173_102403 [Hymenobacter mucosus]
MFAECKLEYSEFNMPYLYTQKRNDTVVPFVLADAGYIDGKQYLVDK